MWKGHPIGERFSLPILAESGSQEKFSAGWLSHHLACGFMAGGWQILDGHLIHLIERSISDEVLAAIIRGDSYPENINFIS